MLDSVMDCVRSSTSTEQVSLSLLNINGKIETARTEDIISKRQKNERRTKNGGKTNVKK